MPRLAFWFELASNYSYLAAMRIEAEAGRRGVAVDWRLFLLGPIFRAQGWETSPFNVYEAKGRYVWRDMEREAAGLGLPPVTRPEPFPQHSLLAARLATVGMEDGWGPGFARAVYDAEFARGARIDDAEVLAGLLRGLGIEPAPALERAGSPEIKARLRAATAEAAALGVFGAPSFVAEDGELFWGNDRLESALDWAARGS